MRRVVVAWSGGKDSALALAAIQRDRACAIVGLLTTVSPEFDRVSIHGTRRSILQEQARRLGLPLFEAAIRAGADNAAYEASWAATLDQARTTVGEVDCVVYGDLFLADVRAYRERQCAALGVEPLFPLWGTPTHDLARRVISDGYRAYLTCVDTTQLAASFVGRAFDMDLLHELPAKVDPCGERGEFHTCVIAAPIYHGSIPVTRGEQVLRDERFAYCDFILAHDAAKT